MWNVVIVSCLLWIAISTASCAKQAANGNAPSVPAPNIYASYTPRQLAYSDALLARLRLPTGFRVAVFARGVTDARVIALGPNGVIYVSQPDQGQVTALWDHGQGYATTRRVVASRLDGVHGLAVRGNQLFLATPTRLYVAAIRADGTLGAPRPILGTLPAGGRHPHRTLGFGPDGLLYLSVGSHCNDCVESNPDYAGILQMRADGSRIRVFCRGLRNTMGFAWHPVSHAMWGMDQGSDYRGPNDPPEELNRLVDGGHYGWPWCYGNRQVDSHTEGHPPGMTKAQLCATTQPSVLNYQAHSSPIQLAFYTGRQFPAAYRNDAFITFHGSWNRSPAVGYKVVRVRFNGKGAPIGFEDFLTGFLTDNGAAQFGRPAGLAVAPDGVLLVGDDSQGLIYRITYHG